MQTFFRNYDAALGRWTGVDPMADATDWLTPYQYASNNPVMMNDPMGDLTRAAFDDIITQLRNSPNGGHWSASNPDQLDFYTAK